MPVSVGAEVAQRQILLVGPYGVLGTGVVDAVAGNLKWGITTAARRPVPTYREHAAPPHVSVDLLDREGTTKVLSALDKVTDLVFGRATLWALGAIKSLTCRAAMFIAGGNSGMNSALSTTFPSQSHFATCASSRDGPACVELRVCDRELREAATKIARRRFSHESNGVYEERVFQGQQATEQLPTCRYRERGR